MLAIVHGAQCFAIDRARVKENKQKISKETKQNKTKHKKKTENKMMSEIH